MTQTASDPSPRPPAIEGCIEACRRCDALVEGLGEQPGGDAAYRAVGPHLRHCLEHFSALLKGLGTGVVDYDARDRDPVLERDRDSVLVALREIVAGLAGLDPGSVRRRIEVRQEGAAGATVVMASNVERELVFLSGHTIHHLAIMKLLAERAGVTVAEGIDMAFSTRTHLARAVAERQLPLFPPSD